MSDTLIRRFAARVHSLRLERGMSQELLASKSRLHPNFISALERGTKVPSLTSLGQLAQGLGVSLRELLDLPDEGAKVDDRMTEELALLNQFLRGKHIDVVRRSRKALELLLGDKS